MKHLSVEEVGRCADVRSAVRLSRRDRLERWARLLETDPDRRLSTLYQTEHVPRGVLRSLRAEGSPLSVAYADPVLRGDGLDDDTYGAARRYFKLSDADLHYVTCYCHFGDSVSAGQVAGRLRRLIGRADRAASIGRFARVMLRSVRGLA